MYLYSKNLGKDVYVAKVDSNPNATADGATVLCWTKETGWRRVLLKYFEPPRQEGKE